MSLVCSDCKEPIESYAITWREVVGFERLRTGGGLNSLADRRLTGKLICNACMAKRKAGVAPGQEGLL